MWFHSLLASWSSGRSRVRRPQPRPARWGPRLSLEQLEDRALLSAYTAGSVSDLIADINAANAAGGANTIALTAAAAAPYVLTAVNNSTTNMVFDDCGNTGLPVIAANDNLTILGNGNTIERSTATGTPDFRLLSVASGGSLTLENLTLQGGLILGSGTGKDIMPSGPVLNGAAVGGAIYNEGTLVLNGVIVQDNVAGRSGSNGPNTVGITAAGGGILSNGGSVTLEGGTILQNNEALGTDAFVSAPSGAGSAYGGGLFASGSAVIVTNATLDDNTAAGGLDYLQGPDGGAYGGGLCAFGGALTLTNATLDGDTASKALNPDHGNSVGSSGGALYLARATATLTNCNVQGNSALGGTSPGEGGGLFIVAGSIVSLDAATVAQVTGNTASSGATYDNIVGPYTNTAQPTVVNAASASPSPVTGTTTKLSVLGADAAGAELTYTWAVTSAPAGTATPTFSSNGSNGSQNTTATFSRAGTYTFQVTITDPSGLTAVSSVTVTVVPTLTSLSVTPANVTLADGAKQQFTAAALDQFGQALASQPKFTWQVSGSGTLSSTGLYTAPKKGTGTFQVTVSADGLSAQANVIVT